MVAVGTVIAWLVTAAIGVMVATGIPQTQLLDSASQAAGKKKEQVHDKTSSEAIVSHEARR